MMIDFNNKHLFTPVTHPESGVTCHVLSKKVAPVQQGFYFVDFGLQLQWLFGTLPLDGGDFQLWHRFDRLYNHAQFSTTDSDAAVERIDFPHRCWHSHASRDSAATTNISSSRPPSAVK